jgi:pimeloyl-ACP methyl ester carboxylesterase
LNWPSLSRSRVSLALLATIVFTASGFSESAVPVLKPLTTASPAIIIGFVGGFVRYNNINHGPVQLAQRIRGSAPKDTYVQVFENRHRRSAYRTILRVLDTNHDGILSPQEKSDARIVLFGHSWGASAVVLLARDLQREGIPVRLTAQVDSVAKLWQNDAVIPGNVAEAVNYFQPHGFIHGRSRITAADPSRTQILGNYLFDYKKDPIECSGTSWWDRVFTPGHMQSECDARLWSRVEALVRQSLEPSSSTAIVGLQINPVSPGR